MIKYRFYILLGDTLNYCRNKNYMVFQLRYIKVIFFFANSYPIIVFLNFLRLFIISQFHFIIFLYCPKKFILFVPIVLILVGTRINIKPKLFFFFYISLVKSKAFIIFALKKMNNFILTLLTPGILRNEPNTGTLRKKLIATGKNPLK